MFGLFCLELFIAEHLALSKELSVSNNFPASIVLAASAFLLMVNMMDKFLIAQCQHGGAVPHDICSQYVQCCVHEGLFSPTSFVSPFGKPDRDPWAS